MDALNGYNLGSIDPVTPHLDSIRNSGLNFSNAWSSPVCTPTRAGMMSGMYGSKNGVLTAPGNLDTAYTSIFKALKSSSPTYTTAVTGKWHIAKPVVEMHPIWHGADHYTGVLEGAVLAYDNWPYIPRCLKGQFIDNTFKIGPNCPASTAAADCATASTMGIENVKDGIGLSFFPNPAQNVLQILMDDD